MIPQRESWQIAPEPGWPRFEYPIGSPADEVGWEQEYWIGNIEHIAEFSLRLAVGLFEAGTPFPDRSVN